MNFKSAVIVLAFLIFSCTNNPTDNSPSNLTTVINHETNNNIYGFETDNLLMDEKKIYANENLSDILLHYKVSYQTIDKIATRSNKVFDVSKFQIGKKYKIYYMDDSAKTPKYFVYEPSPIDYVVYELFEPLNVYPGKKKVEIRIKEASGIISKTLWETMIDNHLSPLLVIDLSEVYAWQIDFFRIQKEDKFKIIFEEKYVNGQFVETGKIIAAYFRHNKNDFNAILFHQNNNEEYFDENGKSLKKEFLKAPLKYSRISSGYSKRRFHPVLKTFRPHLGTDYAAPTGTPIRSVGDGVILEAQYKGGNGRYVKVRHNSIYTTAYLHMSKINKGIKPGVRIKQSQIIGYVGSSGLATGPHLCFRFYKNDIQIDALKVKTPPSQSVSAKNQDRYNQLKTAMMKRLNTIEFL